MEDLDATFDVDKDGEISRAEWTAAWNNIEKRGSVVVSRSRPTERACLAKQATAIPQKAQSCIEAATQKFGPEASVTPGQETRTTQKWLGAPLTGLIRASVLDSPTSLNSDPTHQLLFVKSLAVKGSRKIVLDLLRCQSALESMAAKIWTELQVLKYTTAISAEEWIGKFARDAICTMALGGLNIFYGGLEAFTGSPIARVLEAMMHEHCEEKDSSKELEAGNDVVTTTSKTEWLFAAAMRRKVRTSAELDLIMEDLKSQAGHSDARGEAWRRDLLRPLVREVQGAGRRRGPRRSAGRLREDAVPEDLPWQPVRCDVLRHPPEAQQISESGDGVLGPSLVECCRKSSGTRIRMACAAGLSSGL